MEVTFVKTSKSNLNNVPVQPGQFVFTDDSKQLYMDFDQERKGVASQDEVDAIVDVNGCCNVFAIDNPILLTGVDVSNNGIINTSTDAIPLFNFLFRAFVSDSPIILAAKNINETGNYAFNVTIPNNTQRLMFKHDGFNQDLAITIPSVPAGNYKLTFTVVSCDPTTVGGLAIRNIMLYDARLNPTRYVPYAMTNAELTESTLKYVKVSKSSFTWDTSTLTFKCPNPPSEVVKNKGFVVKPLNGMAIMGGYYSTISGYLYVFGWIPSNAQSVNDEYDFDCYILI